MAGTPGAPHNAGMNFAGGEARGGTFAGFAELAR
jgi:hypothetical protein